MDPDLLFAIGVVVGVFSIPAMVSAFSERRAPRVAMFAVVVSGLMIIFAIDENPGRYSVGKLPEILVKVVANYLT